MYKLQKIPSYSEPTCIVRLSDNLHIPFDPDNTSYQAYLKWVDGYEMVNGVWEKTSNGNTPEPAEENQ